MALRLKPDDAVAYARRGHVWKAVGQKQKAIADYIAAMRFDPTKAEACRGFIRKLEGTDNFPASSPQPQTANAPPRGLTGFFKRLAQYYAEFLSTDFKKQRLPRRRLQNADAHGRLVGIPLRKYPGFQQKLWRELAKPVGTGLSLPIARGSWRSMLPKAVVEAIARHIAMVRQEDLNTVITTVMGKVAKAAERKSGDPDIPFEQFIEIETLGNFVAPSLSGFGHQ
jgi:hypothetical protein